MSKTRKGRPGLVVDACVARSAGGEDATASISVHCREALKAVKQSQLDVVMSDELHHEWSRHKSIYARAWLVEMQARKRVRLVEPPARADLRNAARRHLPQAEQTIVHKDLLLVELALAAGASVLSHDDRVRGHLATLAPHVPALRALHWGNPLDDGCVDWLARDALPQAAYLLLPRT